MKRAISLLIMFALVTHSFAEDVINADMLLARVKTALIEKSTEKLTSLTYTGGMSATDKEQMQRLYIGLLAESGIDSVTLAPLPKGKPAFLVANGKRREPSCRQTGVILITYKENTHGITSSNLYYGEVDGTYYLSASKVTDVSWNGPKDHQITFYLDGNRGKQLNVEYKYNASGVDQVGSASGTVHQTFGVAGQYFSEITVASDDPESEIELRVEDNGKTIYKSASLKGKGEIRYLKE